MSMALHLPLSYALLGQHVAKKFQITLLASWKWTDWL